MIPVPSDNDIVLRPVRDTKYRTISAVPVEDDHRLSWKAAGVLGYLTTRPDGWVFREADIINRAPDGRDGVRAALRELTRLGYRHVDRVRRPDGTYGGTRWCISELPVPDWADDPEAAREVLDRAGVEALDLPDSLPGTASDDGIADEGTVEDNTEDDDLGWGDDERLVEVLDLGRRLGPTGQEFLVRYAGGWGPVPDEIGPDDVEWAGELVSVDGGDVELGDGWEDQVRARWPNLRDNRRDQLLKAARRVLDLRAA